MKPLEHSHLECIYCDDFRNEENDKTTIVGWYNSSSIQLPPDAPLILPSLCIIGIVSIPLELTLTSCKFELTQDETILQSIDVPASDLEVGFSKIKNQLLQYGRQLRIVFKLANIRITQPGVLRLRAVINGEIVYGNGFYFLR